MQALDLSEFATVAADFDAAVLQTGNVDLFCSSSYWILPAIQAFHPEHEPWLYRSEDGAMWAAMALGVSPSVGRFVAPFESMWGLATPFVGADTYAVAEFVASILKRRERDWDALWLSGLQRGTPSFDHLVQTFGSRYRLGLGPSTKRHVASLEGGWDTYLARRTRKFRKNLRRSKRLSEARGLVFERYPSFDTEATAMALYDRILAVEATSWKGQTDQGINTGSMVEFYRLMLPRLARDNRLRVVVATDDGADVGYVFGAVFGGTFRGLQVSFNDEYREMSLGNIMQSEMIQLLCGEGVDFYDLGSDLPYKTRWAEPGLVTLTVAVLP